MGGDRPKNWLRMSLKEQGTGAEDKITDRQNVVPGSTLGEEPDLQKEQEQEKQKQQWKRGTVSTLFVPFTVGSKLRTRIKAAEDNFVSLTKAKRVRVMEKGGQTG